MGIQILNDKKKFKWTLNEFEWNSIMKDDIFIWCIKYDKKTSTNIYIDRFELKKEYRWKWLWKIVLQELFKTYSKIDLSADKKAIWFWLKIWAKDLWRDTGTHWAWDREMGIHKKDFLDVISGKKLPWKLETFYDKPYNQDKDNFEDNKKSHLYKSVWNDNKLPLWTKLYTPDTTQINQYKEWEQNYKWTLFSIIPNKNKFIIAKKWLKVTRYSNIKFEDGYYKSWLSKYDFAKKKFDAMVNDDVVEIF